MTKFVLLVWIGGVLVGTANAKPLLISWSLPQDTTAIERIEIRRAVKNGPWTTVAIIRTLSETTWTDNSAQWNKGEHCYMAQSVSAEDVNSAATRTVCATPLK